MERIITDQKYARTFCKWLDERLPRSHLDPVTTRTIAYVDFEEGEEGKLKANILAVAAFHHWSDKAVEIAVASNGEKRQKTSHEFIWTYFSYVFDVCKKEVLYASIEATNDKCIALAEKVGYTKRGFVPDYFGADRDAFIYAITRREWQKGRFSTKEPIQINTPITLGRQENSKEVIH